MKNDNKAGIEISPRQEFETFELASGQTISVTDTEQEITVEADTEYYITNTDSAEIMLIGFLTLATAANIMIAIPPYTRLGFRIPRDKTTFFIKAGGACTAYLSQAEQGAYA